MGKQAMVGRRDLRLRRQALFAAVKLASVLRHIIDACAWATLLRAESERIAQADAYRIVVTLYKRVLQEWGDLDGE